MVCVCAGEEGQDAGGLLREWYLIISREIFNPNYALFQISPGDRVTYTISPSSHCNSNHLSYFKFVGRIIAKAIYDNKLLECYFTRSFYKHVLGQSVRWAPARWFGARFFNSTVIKVDLRCVFSPSALLCHVFIASFSFQYFKSCRTWAVLCLLYIYV